MKKFLTLTAVFVLLCTAALAEITPESVKTFFNSYVSASNNFDQNLFQKYYISNPEIIRTVQKKDGTTESVKVPMKVYLEESKKGQGLAKMVRYKNTYTDIKVTKSGNDYKVSAIRNPSPGGHYPAYFIIGSDSNGNLKIKTEAMNTPRQEFLQK